jgi:Secretion system C-terminal sorting domain
VFVLLKLDLALFAQCSAPPNYKVILASNNLSGLISAQILLPASLSATTPQFIYIKNDAEVASFAPTLYVFAPGSIIMIEDSRRATFRGKWSFRGSTFKKCSVGHKGVILQLGEFDLSGNTQIQDVESGATALSVFSSSLSINRLKIVSDGNGMYLDNVTMQGTGLHGFNITASQILDSSFGIRVKNCPFMRLGLDRLGSNFLISTKGIGVECVSSNVEVTNGSVTGTSFKMGYGIVNTDYSKFLKITKVTIKDFEYGILAGTISTEILGSSISRNYRCIRTAIPNNGTFVMENNTLSSFTGTCIDVSKYLAGSIQTLRIMGNQINNDFPHDYNVGLSTTRRGLDLRGMSCPYPMQIIGNTMTNQDNPIISPPFGDNFLGMNIANCSPASLYIENNILKDLDVTAPHITYTGYNLSNINKASTALTGLRFNVNSSMSKTSVPTAGFIGTDIPKSLLCQGDYKNHQVGVIIQGNSPLQYRSNVHEGNTIAVELYAAIGTQYANKNQWPGSAQMELGGDPSIAQNFVIDDILLSLFKPDPVINPAWVTVDPSIVYTDDYGICVNLPSLNSQASTRGGREFEQLSDLEIQAITGTYRNQSPFNTYLWEAKMSAVSKYQAWPDVILALDRDAQVALQTLSESRFGTLVRTNNDFLNTLLPSSEQQNVIASIDLKITLAYGDLDQYLNKSDLSTEGLDPVKVQMLAQKHQDLIDQKYAFYADFHRLAISSVERILNELEQIGEFEEIEDKTLFDALSASCKYFINPDDQQALSALKYLSDACRTDLGYGVLLARSISGSNNSTFDLECAEHKRPESKSDMQSISIYPNPSNGLFFLNSPENLIGKQYQISNAMGQVIQSGTITTSKNFPITINSSVKGGIYFVNVSGAAHKQRIFVY